MNSTHFSSTREAGLEGRVVHGNSDNIDLWEGELEEWHPNSPHLGVLWLMLNWGIVVVKYEVGSSIKLQGAYSSHVNYIRGHVSFFLSSYTNCPNLLLYPNLTSFHTVGQENISSGHITHVGFEPQACIPNKDTKTIVIALT